MNFSTSPEHWMYVTVPFGIYSAVVLVLVAAGEHGEETNIVKIFFRRISWSLERLTGHSGWRMAGVLSGLTVLGVAMMGLYWDVAFHIDVGRDKELFTPSHTMIVLGLAGLVYSAVIAVIFATVDRVPVGWRFLGLRIPRSALALAVLGAGGVAAFPLDNLWHQAYGVDVTLWSPSHLQLVLGGGLGPIALWLMMREHAAESRPRILGRAIDALVLGSVLTGLSAVQGEFDFGVPQFQLAYLPILVAVAAGFSLVLARVSLGPGGAIKAVVAFLVLRSVVALLVGGALNHTVPRFPLYLGGALVVELAAWLLGTERRLRFSLAAGALVGTLGVVAELAWVELSGWFGTAGATGASLPATALLAVPAAAGAAVVGVGLARAVPGGTRVPLAAAAVAGAVVLVALAVPLPRNVGAVEAIVRLQPGAAVSAVEVELQPQDAAQGHSLALVSWQGGGRVLSGLREVSPGRYASVRPVPVAGGWKSMVSLQRGDEVMAAPVYLPADPEIGAPEVPAVAERRERFVRNTEVLLRESRPGPAWVRIAAYAGLAAVVAAWWALFALCARAPRREAPTAEEPGTETLDQGEQPEDSSSALHRKLARAHEGSGRAV
ncbi:MAG: hypothetical protein M3378_09620 [Actinomycetota bacterium]|nr:hypothetical protein [Actinomycetota bacterium]